MLETRHEKKIEKLIYRLLNYSYQESVIENNNKYLDNKEEIRMKNTYTSKLSLESPESEAPLEKMGSSFKL